MSAGIIDAETAGLIQAVNGLSNDAVYLASRDWFASNLAGRPILAVTENGRQEAAFLELLDVGFVYVDIERGQVGYRSTMRGQTASSICRAALDGPR